MKEMNMGEAVKSVLSNYANFNGRARRSEYWWFYLAVILVTLVPTILLGIGSATAAAATVGGHGPAFPVISVIGLVLLIPLTLALIIPSLAVAVRRLHDQGKSGAWWFIQFVPFIGTIWFIILLATEGTRGPNQYGPDPKAYPASPPPVH